MSNEFKMQPEDSVVAGPELSDVRLLGKMEVPEKSKLKIAMISLHGLIRAREPELGCDADTGGQVKYVLELARELAAHPKVQSVELITRQIVDSRVAEDYARLEEPISDGAKIVRIPFGPRRYVKKESLWPFIEMFVDQALVRFRRTGVPNIIHGHYADAGYAGALLARLLSVPFLFTGHSLGRVKRQRLSLGKADPQAMERKYHFRRRIEAEETALETASMVVTSTHQEVEQQYQLYDHYQPSRMEVIPPGVDLEQFFPPGPDWHPPEVADSLNCFLREPDKPIILTMARPDERKNLQKLVHVYGKSQTLQQLANLVLVMGTRDDLKTLPKSQQNILSHILYLIDRYGLYGKVAYPKTHLPSDVPDLYRMAAYSKGVFINPALTEPFGLTLLEAGASGVPIVATNDGGPRDIIANCQNGLLIDPLDEEGIERALLRALTEPESWQTWSKNGVTGTPKHYSWSNHTERYLRDLSDILAHSPSSVQLHQPARRLPEFDRIIITDLDNTLTGDDESLKQFCELIRRHDHIGFGIATGRRLDSALQLIEELDLPRPDLISSDTGTLLHYGEKLLPDTSWQKSIGFAWKPEQIVHILENVPGLELQDAANQSEYKISYVIDTRQKITPAKIRKILRSAGLRARVIVSHSMYLDIIPVRGGSDMSLRHVLWKWGFAPEHVLVAGDSGNDEGMLVGRILGVVVANHSHELKRLKKHPRIYFANASHAAGILEGIEYYHFLDSIVIPNDRIG
jgi:sucrose-phosphate synthase